MLQNGPFRSEPPQMKLSVIVPTRNRARNLALCLDSIAAAIAKAGLADAEIVVTDNGSTDATSEVLAAWARTGPVRLRQAFEPRPGRGRAVNAALRLAEGELLALTDDDCRLHPDYVGDLLRYDAADTALVLRGGRQELGDPTDLPFTINLNPKRQSWSRAMNSARHVNLGGKIAGCNMTMRRALIDRIGPFDERFGPGSRVGCGDDFEFMCRAYIGGVTLEHVPDMTVFHHHGRKTSAEIHDVLVRNMLGVGGVHLKFLLRHPNLCRQTLWDLKGGLREIATGTNTYLPAIGFSHKQKLTCSARGALRYLFARDP
jgi:glycosyltransferase involved in cell wall biosynthesis